MHTAIRTRRPAGWSKLSETEGALLDFLRNGGQYAELSPQATIQKILTLMRQDGRFEHLASIADSEPPRVRAMLGALGEQLGSNPRTLQALQRSLNPLSRFDFGILSALPNAREWQAKIGN
jgi:hypothetical protein